MKRILIVGKPNSGKTLLFNRLTGLIQKIANFPGVTVELKRGRFDGYEVVDFPGVYSINPLTTDETIAVGKFREEMQSDEVKAVVCLLDATRLERSLVFGLQAHRMAHEFGKACVFALNMMDEISKKNTGIDIEGLQRELGSPVFGISSRTGWGLEAFKSGLKKIIESYADFIPAVSSRDDDRILAESKELGKRFGKEPDLILKNQNRWDRFFLNGVTGGITFFLIMMLLFQSIFTWSAPLMDITENFIAALGALVTGAMAEGPMKDFFQDAVFGGFGAFLVFVPQIMVLTFVIGLLEDSGHLARAAIIVHRPLSFFGLSGRSFVPYLSGFACAIPAMMAARTIESPKKRLITVLTIPLMSCSARLPVYSLLITALIPAVPLLGGFITLQGFAFFALFLFGILMALVVSSFLGAFTLKGESDIPFMIELPPYRIPDFRSLVVKSFNSAKAFVVNAGAIIFIVSVVVWMLGYFPDGSGSLETSWLASLGRFIDPLFQPLGVDWRYGVAILASFLAREVFVGTLGTLFGIEGADENIEGLAMRISGDGLELSAGIGLLVFYAVALQCVSTVAVMKKEVGGGKIPLLVFFGYSLLAYILAVSVRWILG